MKVKLNVYKKYFRQNCRGSGRNCPVASAALAAGLDDVFVDGNTLSGDYNGERVHKDLPAKAVAFIRRFDDETIPLSKFKPFSFSVNL